MAERKVTIDDSWKEIKELREKGYTYQKIADIYGVTKQCIQQGLSKRIKGGISNADKRSRM